MYTEANAPDSIEGDCGRAVWKLDWEMQFLAQSMNIGDGCKLHKWIVYSFVVVSSIKYI